MPNGAVHRSVPGPPLTSPDTDPHPAARLVPNENEMLPALTYGPVHTTLAARARVCDCGVGFMLGSIFSVPLLPEQLARVLPLGGFTTIGPTVDGAPSPREFRAVSAQVYRPPTERLFARIGLSVPRTLWDAPPFDDV